MPDIFIQSFTHLKDKGNADKALHLLKRIASLVKPIMRKRNWVLPVLAEFFPDDPNLLGLNINMGQQILVRLRHAYSPDTFLPEETVVGTMLHELTHNVHGPHDDKFYKYLSGLEDEYDALQRSGYAGEGFFSEGKRLGGNVSHNVPLHTAHLKALEAAEKRKQTSRVLGRGGQLGGQNRNAGLSPRELAARAAERRARDEKSCVSGPAAQREAEKAAKESKVIDLTLDDDEEQLQLQVRDMRKKPLGPEHPHTLISMGNLVRIYSDQGEWNEADRMHYSDTDSDVVIVENVHRKPSSSSAIVSPSSVPQRISPSSSSKANKLPVNRDISPSSKTAIRKPSSRPQAERVEWSCQACTLLNPYTALQCEACNMRRPPDEREGWTCSTCIQSGNPHDVWMCHWCGTVKLQS